MIKFEIDILMVEKLYAFRQRRNFGNFRHFYIFTFNWKGNCKFWWFHRKDLVQIYQNKIFSNCKIYFVIFYIIFIYLIEYKYLYYIYSLFFLLLTIYSDFVNCDDCIGKISSISIRNKLNLSETHIFGSIKMNFNVNTLDLC